MASQTDGKVSDRTTEALEAVPLDRIPAAIALLAARLMVDPPRTTDATDGERYLSPDQITDEYGFDRRWVYANAERLGAVKLGHRTIRVPESGLKRHLEAHRMRRDGP